MGALALLLCRCHGPGRRLDSKALEVADGGWDRYRPDGRQNVNDRVDHMPSSQRGDAW